MNKTGALDVERPFTMAMINRAGSLLAWLGMHWPRLSEETLLERASKVTG